MRTFLKGLANAVAIVLAAPVAGWFRLYALLVPSRAEDAFQGCTQWLSLLPGTSGTFVRRGFLWLACRNCSLNSSVGFGTIFVSPLVELGAGVYIGPYCVVGHAIIGADTMLGTGVHLVGGRRAHGVERLDIPMRNQPRAVQVIRIGPDCWIGNQAVVMEDLGGHVIVGAAAVVTKPVDSWMVVVGNPAKVVRDRRTREAAALEPGPVPDQA